jgi:serine/threonine-protein kinase
MTSDPNLQPGRNDLRSSFTSGNRLACDRELLRQSLNDALSDAQEEELSRHLSECPGCQQELERLAGGRAEWLKVGSVLKQEAESPGRSMPVQADHAADQIEDADTAADFAVDFLEPSPSPDALGRLADIDVLEVIGRGGMGIVLKGFQPELKRLVAVKVLAPHLAVSGAARKRFAREAQAAAAILHPNVMPILTIHSSGKLPFLVMPYLACESLQQRIAREGPLELADLLRIGVQAASGLAAAHAQGLVHRDVKPANILLEKGVERVMLTDFGLARAVDDASITRTGIIAGTPQFMSPEQARGEALDARSDLFSLGSVLYTMATGRPPFRAETSLGILRRITDTEPRPIREINPEIPDWLAAIVNKLHAKAPDERFQSAEEVARLLEGCLAHVQQPTAVPLPQVARDFLKHAKQRPTSNRPWRWFTGFRRLQVPVNRPRAVAAAVIALGILAVALIVGVALRHRRDVPKQSNWGTIVEAPTSAHSANATAAAKAGTAWDDDATKRLSGFDREVEQFEQQSSQWWEGPPPAEGPDKSRPIKSPSTSRPQLQEFMK